MHEPTLQASLERFAQRIGAERRPTRRTRADQGASRLPVAIREKLDSLLGGQQYPVMRDVAASLHAFCVDAGAPSPSRATLYNYLLQAAAPRFAATDLPPEVLRTLHNVDLTAPIAGDQIVVSAFNEGSIAALSFASSLPWICLHRAARRRDMRPKARGLLQAIMRCRGIPV